MKKFILPLLIFAAGLLVAHYYFNVDVDGLFRGFGNFLLDIFKGGRK